MKKQEPVLFPVSQVRISADGTVMMSSTSAECDFDREFVLPRGHCMDLLADVVILCLDAQWKDTWAKVSYIRGMCGEDVV
jgi:hypothetical protein